MISIGALRSARVEKFKRFRTLPYVAAEVDRDQLLALAAMYVGIPFVPVSPAYSLTEGALGRLRYVLSLLTPYLDPPGRALFNRLADEYIQH